MGGEKPDPPTPTLPRKGGGRNAPEPPMIAVTRRRFLQSGAAGAASLAAAGATAAPCAGRRRRQGPAVPPRPRHLQPRRVLGSRHDPQSLQGRRHFAGRAADDPQARRRADPDQGRSARRSRKRFADAGVEIWGCGTVCEFHSPDAAVVRRTSRPASSSSSWSRTSAARASRCGPTACPRGAGREDAGADRQVADPLRQGGGGRRPRNLGRGPRPRHRPPAAHEDDHGACGHPNVGLTWNSNPNDLEDGSVADVFQAAVAVDQVVPHQRTVQGPDRRLPVPRTVRACSASTATTG